MAEDLRELGIKDPEVCSRLGRAGFSTIAQVAVADLDEPLGGVAAHLAKPWIEQARHIVCKESISSIQVGEREVEVGVRDSSAATRVSVRWLLRAQVAQGQSWGNSELELERDSLRFVRPLGPKRTCEYVKFSVGDGSPVFSSCSSPAVDWGISDGKAYCAEHMKGQGSVIEREFGALKDRAQAEKERLVV